MESAASKRIVHQPTYDSVRVELPTGHLTYVYHINTLSGLNVITNDVEPTAQLFAAVINQAQQPGYSAEWVQAELRIEAQALEVGDRARWLLTDLARQGAANDSLEQYNERLNQFWV